MKSLIAITIALLLSMSFAQTSLTVSPQALEGHTVTIDEATLEQDGFIVVHAFDSAGELVLSPPLGVIYLAAGKHNAIPIALDPVLLAENAYGMDSKNVLPMLHIDANANQVYEFPEGGDVPVMMNDSMVIAELPITYTAAMNMMTAVITGSQAAFTVTLSGAQEVPAVMTDASGTALVSLDGNSFSISGTFQDLSSPVFSIADTPAHVHMGAIGETGDPVILLTVIPDLDGLSGAFIATAELTDAQLDAFKAGQFYLNLHTEMYQSGELRAQLVPQGVLDNMMMGMMDATPSLMVSPQSGSTISLDRVTLSEDGFVVVHAFDSAGELVLSPPLGVTYLTAGTHSNVEVLLDETLLVENAYGSAVKDVLPMLHIDANANQVYEFPDGDDVPVVVGEDMVATTLALTY